MLRRCTALCVALALAGCGRLAFDPTGTQVDGSSSDGVPLDTTSADALIFRVRFEGDAVDVAGGRTPTCLGCPLTFTTSPGGTGQAIRLTGSECLEYADEPALRPPAFTLAAWFRADQARTSSILGKAFDADTTEDNSFEFWVSDNGYVHFTTVDVDNPFVWHAGIAPGTWYHVAGTFEGGAKRIYVNGIERMSSTVAVASYDAEPIRIGCDRGVGAIQNFFIGELDDVRLYRDVLSPSEIAELAQAPP